MMGSLRRLSLIGALQAAIWLAAGCVRLSEPETFVCQSNADRASGLRCAIPGKACVPQDYCTFEVPCPQGRHCAGEHCKIDECSSATEGSACSGFRCDSGACRSGPCTYWGDCNDAFHCDAGKCLPGASFKNGQGCTQGAQCQSGTCCAKPSGSVCAYRCPAVPDDSCMVAEDCLSGLCCEAPSGKLTCSAVPCDEAGKCSDDLDCEPGYFCVGEQCKEPGLPGDPCMIDAHCSSKSCAANLCRGTAGAGRDCKVDNDCQAGRHCCEAPDDPSDLTCGELDRGCPGSIGDLCEFDFECIDNDCIGNFTGFCSKPCTTNADCGVSPWGVPNACETNGLGNKICFPGCTSSEQCWDNLNTGLDCYDAFDSAGRICADE
jgi:hypothetical protein